MKYLIAAAIYISLAACLYTAAGAEALLAFPNNADGICGVCIGGIAQNDTPIWIAVTDKKMSEEHVYTAGYRTVTQNPDGSYTAEARVETEYGSVFDVLDVYTLEAGYVVFTRDVTVVTAGEGDAGFYSRYALDVAGDSRRELLIPAIVYRDGQNITENAICEDLTVEELFVKEVRTGLPMVMLRDSGGNTVSVAHLSATPSAPGGDKRRACDEAYQYGSVGAVHTLSGVAFAYPAREYPVSYNIIGGDMRLYHPITIGVSHAYTLGIAANTTTDFNQAMITHYTEQFAHMRQTVYEVDLDEVYTACVEDLADLVTYTGDSVGIPFAVFVTNDRLFTQAAYQIGFIGMQTSLASHLLAYSPQKAMDILNFWARQAALNNGLMKVWADAYTFRAYPPYLRIMTDGMEGMLDACIYIRDDPPDGVDVQAWEAMVTAYADFLVSHQNTDGSFYRAYDYQGNAFSDDNTDGLTGDQNTQGDSKLNSAVPIRFLVRMWEYTKEDDYLSAALAAGEYVLEVLYPQGGYAGGTPDNPNTVDREAGVFALYAYSALYSATGDTRYLAAAQQAAVYCMTWVYTYKFSAENPVGRMAGVPTEQDRSDGLSLIATGHSAADSFLAYLYYEMFKLYLWTEDDFYYEAALLLQCNTKQTMNLDNQFGYARLSYMIEATDISNFLFTTAEGEGVWLPWITCANIEPVLNMRRTFGCSDIRDLESCDADSLLDALTAYGAGGRYEATIFSQQHLLDDSISD